MIREALHWVVSLAQPVQYKQETLDEQGGVAVVPEGRIVVPLEEYRTAPSRTKGVACLESPEAFAEYVKRWAVGTHSTVVYISEACDKAVAVITDGHPGDPEWGDHRAVFTLEFSPEWEQWESGHKVYRGQVEFVEFLEDHVDTVEKGGELLAKLQDFQLTRDVEFRSAVVLNTGEVGFNYTSENREGQAKLPATFTIQVPVYQRGPVMAVRCRLKYRLNNGALRLCYEIIRLDKVREVSFDHMHDRIGDLLPEGVPFLAGTPR